jgi:hypothetical protein
MIGWLVEMWQRRPWSTAYCLFAASGIVSTIIGQWVGVI